MMYRSGKGSSHSHGTPVDVLPTTAGIPSTLNPLLRYCHEFRTHSHGNTATVSPFSWVPGACEFSQKLASFILKVMMPRAGKCKNIGHGIKILRTNDAVS